MKVVGFNFNKISLERFVDKLENLKIITNINILEISETKSEFFKTKEELITVKFNYLVEYKEKIASVELAGFILFALDSKLAKEVLKQWKEKKIPEEFRIILFNVILKKASLKALQLEEEMGLPLHITLPSMKTSDSIKKAERDK